MINTSLNKKLGLLLCSLFISATSTLFASAAFRDGFCVVGTAPVRLASALGADDCVMPAAAGGTYEQVLTLRQETVSKDGVTCNVGRAFVIPRRGISEETLELRMGSSESKILYVFAQKPASGGDFSLSAWTPEAWREDVTDLHHRIVFAWCGEAAADGKQTIYAATPLKTLAGGDESEALIEGDRSKALTEVALGILTKITDITE